jgi:hypothetical protein
LPGLVSSNSRSGSPEATTARLRAVAGHACSLLPMSARHTALYPDLRVKPPVKAELSHLRRALGDVIALLGHFP